jgi:hypothetical protein
MVVDTSVRQLALGQPRPFGLERPRMGHGESSYECQPTTRDDRKPTAKQVVERLGVCALRTNRYQWLASQG